MTKPGRRRMAAEAFGTFALVFAGTGAGSKPSGRVNPKAVEA